MEIETMIEIEIAGMKYMMYVRARPHCRRWASRSRGQLWHILVDQKTPYRRLKVIRD
jgi:hypothetical protein